MDVRSYAPPPTSTFRAKEAGIILLVTLVSLLLGDYFVMTVLDYLQNVAGFSWFKVTTEGEVGATRSIISGFLNPALMVVVPVVLLKMYLPGESCVEIGRRVGLSGISPLRTTALAFGVGASYVFLFMSLGHLYPPDEFVAPHPENVINHASTSGKILFAVGACTVVPIAEEFLFRGVLYEGIANSWGKVGSAICVSVAFIAVHPGTIGSGYWVSHMELYLSPLLMVTLREMTGALYAPMAAHSGFNFAEIFF